MMPTNKRLLWIIGGGLMCLLIVAASLAVVAGRADAHGVQVISDPSPNARLPAPPELITVTFNEPIEPSVSTIQLWDQSPKEIPLGPMQFFDDPTVMAAPVPQDLPPGTYVVVWRNLSTIDGHTWSGSFVITIGSVEEAPDPTAFDLGDFLGQPPSDNPSTLESAARWVVLLGSAIMLGGAAYVLFVVQPAARVLAPASNVALRGLSRTVLLVTGAIAVFLVLEGSLLQLVLQADRLGGIGRVDELLVDTRFGRYLIARQGLLAIALLALGLIWRARGGRWAIPALGLLLVASLGVLFTQSLVSHAAASDGEFWTTSIDVLHLLAASLWIGGLIHIGLAMPRWLDELEGVPRTLFAAESFRRFSALAAVSVSMLLISGVLSAFVQFTSWDELWSTSYGWSLVGKMGAMLPLLAMAAVNAFILQPRVVAAGLHLAGGSVSDDDMPSPDLEAAGRLQRLLVKTVRVEAVLGMVVLVAVAVLIQLQAPRSAAEAEELAAIAQAAAEQPIVPDYYRDSREVDSLIAFLEIRPGKVGENSFALSLGVEFGSIGEILDAHLEFEHVDLPESELDLVLSGSAFYSAEGANLSRPGDWNVTVHIVRRGVENDWEETFRVPIADPSAGVEPAEGKPESIWQWPFDGGRSTGAIAVLAVAAAGIAGWGGLRLLRRS